jgi:hypothetical protein
LIEGEDSSVDKKVYSSILGKGFNDFVLLPVGNVQTLHNFENIRERILDKSIWGVDFFMLCDHDAPYSSAVVDDDFAYPRLRRIKRYHIENYFLEEEILASVFRDLDSEIEWLCDPTKIAEELRRLASQKLGYACALIVARTIWRQGGNVRLLPKGCDSADEETLVGLMLKMAEDENSRIKNILSKDRIEAITRETFALLEASLANGDDWKIKIPGKAVLKSFFGKAGIKDAHVKSAYIKKAEQSLANPFAEIKEIFTYFRDLNPARSADVAS